MQIILMNIVNQLNVQLFSDSSMYIYLNYANIFFFISDLLIVISTEKQEKFMFAKSWWI